ncbi:hypothetical protein HA951_000874 [Neisseria gonorrhoeae]|uniref:Phage associated protein n=2 Tax=Neisseria gonorrhoeae TaxID=485 RepID=A0AB74ED93_NEIGO|nr:hypothetical protein [Neisseria gonorrhoeae]KLS32780.1 hypothetical protein M723_05320 [Neisseria gonorrhoeae ATL_2011_01_03]MCK2172302.1 hypothetical protein [Neisseria gonorrhoeae]MDO6017202.1 hypothetical protein [Neisseria gonorrhoeae]TJW90149.1 hypothetical protein E8M66_06590 [Neisseria gonorrhoeae]TJX15266.1 hypothetical protein E8M61_09555 [Neisseria gonorrhoeae]
MNDIETFLNQRNHAAKSDKVSVLEPYKDEIFQLKNMGYAEKIIVDFLSEMKGVNVSRQAVNRFIRSRSAQMHNTAQNKPIMATDSVTMAQTAQAAETAKNQAENTPARRGLRKPTPTKKFNWEEKPDPETLK